MTEQWLAFFTRYEIVDGKTVLVRKCREMQPFSKAFMDALKAVKLFKQREK